MARTASTMLPLGTPLPDFALPDVTTGQVVTPATFSDRQALVVMFICRHCPFVKHVQAELARLGQDYEKASVGIVAISSNDAQAYPDDAPASLRTMATELGFRFPVLFDETQAVAQTFTAACTPDFFLFGPARTLVYRGQLDSSRPGNAEPVTGEDLRAALDATLAGRPVPEEQRPSIGCNIKWRPGQEPDYYRH
ncbi:MAG: thioredoxin family protein [Gloeomargaritaceae cyanobacterium C42_A2020_066]|nr:thioredoxin family protein [Gloeomargaritaceae cyanobacterium C42_A2020_066]